MRRLHAVTQRPIAKPKNYAESNTNGTHCNLASRDSTRHSSAFGINLQAQWRQSAGLFCRLADTARQWLAAKAYRRTDAVELGAPTDPLNCWHVPKGGRAPLTVELIGNVIEVAHHLRLLRVSLGPFPFPHQLFRKCVAVRMAFGIASRAGVAVPIPGTPTPPPASSA